MNKMFIANLKTNLNLSDVANYINTIDNFYTEDTIVILPSLIHIPFFISNNFKLGAQYVSKYNKGSYTGEVSAEQLYETKVEYCIVGHSERRILYNETDDNINEKIKNLLQNKIKPILCIGENKEERIAEQTKFKLKRQILDGLENIDKTKLDEMIIAYEPIWAIGTGITPTYKEIEELSLYIKDIAYSAFKIKAKVLYGGSVNSKNIVNLKHTKETDGFLIGNASINPNEFIKIVNELS